MKNLRDVTNKLDSVLKTLSQKDQIYDSLINKITRQKKFLTEISEHAIIAQKEKFDFYRMNLVYILSIYIFRVEAKNRLENFRNSETADEIQLKKEMFMTKLKFKIDQEMNEFLHTKSKRFKILLL